MTAMTIEDGQFVEGEMSLFNDTWFCTEHSTSNKVGRECAFCQFDLLGPVEFDRWADAQAAKSR